MRSLKELKKIVKEGLKVVKKQPGLLEGLVYASSNRRVVGRLVYTTHIPSNGLEEPKSDEDFGIAVEVWFEKNGKKLLGFGHEPSELSLKAVHRALQKAVRDAVEDQDFTGFLKPKELPKYLGGVKVGYHDKKLMEMKPEQEAKILARISWETIEGAVDGLNPYLTKHKLSPKDLAFILNGDNFIVKERMALATTNGIYDSDETTIVMSFLTAMLEKENSKGSSFGANLHLKDLSPYEIGRQASLAAINGIRGKKIKSGKYSVVFGHQAVTELFGSLYLSHFNLAMVDFGATIYQGQFGKKVASPLLNLYDDATLPGGAGTKRITCEGCPTGKTVLMDKGVLAGFLSNSQTTNKVLRRREELKIKLGVDPHEIRHAISPKNGFRFSRGGGRVAASGVGISATNLVVDSPKPLDPQKIIKKVKEGIFIGRLWYTYPVGGYSSGIISGTAIADCYTIKNGRLSEPILPNTIRLEDNIGRMMQNIIAVGNNHRQTILWASDEITHAPWVAISDVNLISINNEG